MKYFDVLIIGAGAAGLMCAIEAGRRGRSVLVIDHANKPGKKILMSGGGRCNFTNYYTSPDCYISHNSHFSKSALNRFTPQDFIERVRNNHIKYHEKTLGQLFCDEKSSDIVELLLRDCEEAGVEIWLSTSIEIESIKKTEKFSISSTQGLLSCQSLIIATGGLSIPTMGASPFGYKIAEHFGLKVFPTRAGLVPLTLQPEDKEKFAPLSGVSTPASISVNGMSFTESLLITHRGLSGPVILQISSYWNPGDILEINLLPGLDFEEFWKQARQEHPKLSIKNLMGDLIPKRLLEVLIPQDLIDLPMNTLAHSMIENLKNILTCWEIKPGGSEGYRTAEVTLGGVDCDALSSKTFEVKNRPGLYFIGEVLDVSGWLGGYNFQWAWASGWAAGQVV